ncbi:MAG: hypothetical protein EOP47_23070 [Sphingobacteriaceae bacterium]|nr:MAG: hypothetical protein EOP47_23070 [Sphingobacteriaceae bacterium]
MLVISILKYLTSDNPSFLDLKFPLSASAFCFYSYSKLKNRKGQFIEWWSDKIIYKVKDNIEPVEVYLDKITKIDIGVDVIALHAIDAKEHQINIEDFSNYDSRKLIKDKFSDISVNKKMSP